MSKDVKEMYNFVKPEKCNLKHKQPFEGTHRRRNSPKANEITKFREAETDFYIQIIEIEKIKENNPKGKNEAH